MESDAGSLLNDLMSSFNTRVSELRELIQCRNVNPSSSAFDFMGVDAIVSGMEQNIMSIKSHLTQELEVLPTAQDLIGQSLVQQRKVEHMLRNLNILGIDTALDSTSTSSSAPTQSDNLDVQPKAVVVEESKSHKERKGRSPPPRRYLTLAEFDSLSSYMRGRLTLDKVNLAVDEMAQHADETAHLLAAPRNKMAEDLLKRALELRDIAMSDSVKGKHFFLEADLKGPVLKLDNTGKGILTVLRHTGRINETRIGRHRVLILVRSQ